MRYTSIFNSNSPEKNFLKTIDDCFLEQLISEPTRMRGTDTPHLLDLLLVEEPEKLSNVRILPPVGKSDHVCIAFAISTDISAATAKPRRNYYKGNYEAMRSEVSQINWSQHFDDDSSLDEMYTKFQEIILSAEAKFVPIYNDNKRVALPKATVDLIKEKQKAWNEYRTDRDSPEKGAAFRRIRNRVRKSTRREANVREKNLADNIKENPKNFWHHVNAKRRSAPAFPSLIDPVTNTSVDDPKLKADLLNDQFSSVFTREPDVSDPLPNIQGKQEEEIERPQINITKVLQKLRELDPSKSQGPDKLHPRVLKEIASVIAEPLTAIFNKSLELGQLPCLWKKATVSPIFKTGKRSDPSNYRPISLTCIPCKIMESIIADHLTEQLLTQKIITKKQYGFLKRRSAESQLLTAVEDWKSKIDKGYQIDLIYLDLKKAFDKVPHKRLLHKLRQYGLGSLDSPNSLLSWIQSFICGRSQSVVVDGAVSNTDADVLSGVPQGSVLGPLLFNLYINDLVDGIDSTILLYADDTKLYRVIQSPEDSQQLQADLDKINQWMKFWLMEINVTKSHLMTLGRTKWPSSYKIGDIFLSSSDEERDLGIIVDSQVSFRSHYEQTISKANKVAGLLRRSFRFHNEHMLTTLYTSLVRPILEYGHCSVRPFYNRDIEALETVQRRLTKFPPKLRHLPYQQRLERLKLPTLAYRFHRGDLIETYKLCHGMYENVEADDIINFNFNNLRGHSLKLTGERFFKDTGRWSFRNRVPHCWNQLSEETANSPSLSRFKKEIDEIFINEMYDPKCFKRTL